MKKKPFSWKEQLTVNLRGGIWVGLFTLVILAKLIFVCFLDSTDFTSGTLTAYATVLGTFAVSKGFSKMLNGKNGKEVTED